MAEMQACLGVFDAFQSYSKKRESDAAWSLRYPHFWAVVVEVTPLLEGSA